MHADRFRYSAENCSIARTLDVHHWNKNRVARILGISRKALWERRRRYGFR